MHKRLETLLAATAFAIAAGWSTEGGAVVVTLDRFAIVRDGIAIFTDDFSGGGPPPSAPNFSNGTRAAYTSSLFQAAAEAGGRLRLDSSQGNFVTDPLGALRRTQSATLATNTDANQPTLGLKITRNFSVIGIFDLAIPHGPAAEAYGIRLVDNTATQIGTSNVFISGPNHQQVALQVRYNPANGQDEVVWSFADFDAHASTILAVMPLLAPQGADQIALEIDHLANSTSVTGRFGFLSSGNLIGGGDFSATPGQMFQGEVFVRPMFFAIESVPEPGSLALLGLGVALLVAMRRSPLVRFR